MQGLILETSTNRSCLVLMTDGQPAVAIPMDGGENLSKYLGSEVQELLRRHSSFHPDFVAVGTGPGSYTGIRVGAALAKALAFGWGVPIAGFCSMKAFIPSIDGPFAVLIDARMGGIYCLRGQRSSGSVQWGEPCQLPPNEIPDIYLLSPHPSIIERRIGRAVDEAKIDPAALCRAALQASRQSPLAPFPLTYNLEGKPSLL